MDNAATTPVSDSVFEAMTPYLRGEFGNPSSIYSVGRSALRALNRARAQVAAALGAGEREIFFTSCGTESDNWAIKGAARAAARQGKKHIVTTAFEHHAVLHTCEALKKEGFEITYLAVGGDGVVDPADVKAAIRPDTALVTVMYANNEIGTVQPIAAIGAICRAAGVLFHTDAVQAIGAIHMDVKRDSIDLLSLSGHKIHAPKGVGALYIRRGVRIEQFMHGGAQESDKRGGTENVASIVGLGVAVEEAAGTVDARAAALIPLRDKLIRELTKIERSRLNGHLTKRLPGNVNLSFEGVEGESLLLLLDMKGVCASSGSACTSGSLDPSHVLLSIGLIHDVAHGSLRLSLGDGNTEAEVDEVIAMLPPIIERLRAMSPLWDRIKAEEAKQ